MRGVSGSSRASEAVSSGVMAGHTRVICDRCGTAVPAQAHYRVRIDVFADPSPPAVTRDDLEELDFERTVSQLLEEMRDVPAEDLEDAVAKRFEFRLCRSCQLRYIRDPLGHAGGGGAG